MDEMEKILQELVHEKLAEAQAELNLNMPEGLEPPDLAAEYANSLQARKADGVPVDLPDMDKMLQELPEDVRAQIPEAELAKLRKNIAESKLQLEALMRDAATMKAEEPQEAGLDLGQYHPFLKEMTREKVAAMHAASESMEGFNFTDLDLSDMDLSGGLFNEVHFVRTNLKGARLAGAQLQGALFDAADVSAADFTEANLTDSLWMNRTQATQACFVKAAAASMNILTCCFNEANFNEAQLRSSIFNESELNAASFRFADLAHLVLIESQAQQCDLTGALWDDAFLNRSNFSGSCLEKSQGASVIFWESDASALKARGASLPNLIAGDPATIIDNSCFDEADLTGSSLRDISAQGMTARKAVFDNSLLEKVNLSGADWQQARGVGAWISKSRAEHANFSRVNLMQGSLRKTQFKSSDLSAGCFYATEFYQAQFVATRLDAAFTASSNLTERQRREAAKPVHS
ncbi:pentapeptide repeat-containing protein [Candidatus Methylospira mobilis]|uniref:pentapeptide repeat-containing protein n=1 Tax=Candidatus Methylospira mobilis TaxID=1808979 RepID=UPI0028EE2125|nr:pentapeptide repeat-containing protein [Candidatus Methylospira mobilis]WNV05179.1 pentapeptide repeat-containing protein [Candidatus Methylospira mobilis]